jgi:hypothetical protein
LFSELGKGGTMPPKFKKGAEDNKDRVSENQKGLSENTTACVIDEYVVYECCYGTIIATWFMCHGCPQLPLQSPWPLAAAHVRSLAHLPL